MVDRKISKSNAKAGLQLPPRAIRGLQQMGFGRELKKLDRSLRGESTPEGRALLKLIRELNAKFLSPRRKANSDLTVRVVFRLVNMVEYAEAIGKRLQDVRRSKGTLTGKELRSLLGVIYEVELCDLRRQVEGLRRDIPRLIQELGGDPSEELILPHKRSKKP